MSRVTSGAALVAVALVATACGPEANPSTSLAGPVDTTLDASESEWILEIERGDTYSLDDQYWETRLAASDDGILVVGETDDSLRKQRLVTWFRPAGDNWIEGEITPQGGATEFEPWIVSAAPEGFLVAGINTGGGNGRQVAPLLGDGMSWTLTEPGGPGITAIVSEVMGPLCLCGWILSAAPFQDGYLVAGQDMESQSTIWHSTDGEEWSSVAFGPTDYKGIVGVATLDDVAYAFGAAPDPTVWRSTDGDTWEVAADTAALGLDADSRDKVGMLGMVADDGRLYAMVSLDLPFGDEECLPPITECDEQTLVLLTSEDGANWERVPLPEAVRWIDRTASIAAYDGRVYIGTDSNDKLMVWSTDDPTAVVVPPPDEQPQEVREPFVAVRLEPGWASEEETHLTLDPVLALPSDWEPVTSAVASQSYDGTLHIEISSGYLLGEEGIDPVSEPAIVKLTPNSPFAFAIQVAEPPLSPGLHTYEIDVPVWLGKGDPEGSDPDDIDKIQIFYNVFDEARIEAMSGFCDVAVRFQGGPDSVSDLGVFDQLAAEHLDGDLLDRAELASTELRTALEAGGGYSTVDVVVVIADACGRYDLGAVSVAY